MKGFLIFIVGAIIGAIASFVVATGIGAGVGVATGLQAGVCLTVEAAKEKGFITSEQVDEVLAATAQQVTSQEYVAEGAITGGDMQCEKIIAELKAAASKSN
ncbi:MAG: hypothetical protein P8Z31_00575 [Gammaproteobacteria bacterium]|jgi:hypothetical protein